MSDPDALFEPPKPKRRSKGPVYQGVCKTIRRLVADGTVDEEVWAGTIAQARSLADTIDQKAEAGENGVPMSQRHMQLDALLARLNPETTDDSDPFTQMLEEFRRDEGKQRGPATAPHPEV